VTEREYRTRKGALLAQLEWSRSAPGEYLVEGYNVRCAIKAAGLYAGRWEIRRTTFLSGGRSATERHTATSFTDALEWIATQLEERRSP
jgi:hypothetical protein